MAGVVLVVDDDADFRASVVTLLEQAGYATHQAATGKDALRLARGEKPGLVLLDLDLPGVSGYEICREFREEFGQDVAIAFVTGARTEPLDRTAGLLVGADDYIVKPFLVDELLARVNALLRRVGGEAHDRDVQGDLHLTDREYEVLSLLAEGHDQTEIADQLAVMPKTVGRHIEHILLKLNVHSRSQAIALAYRYGLFSGAASSGPHFDRDGGSRHGI